MKKNIIHIISGLDVGGAERFLYRLLTGMDKNHFNHYVFSLKDKGKLGGLFSSMGIPVYELNLNLGFNGLLKFYKASFIINDIRPSIIQGWMYHGNLAASIIAKLIGGNVPVIWNIRHTPYYLKREKKLTAAIIKLGTWLSKGPSRIIYNSETSSKVHVNLGYNEGKKLVIPNGFDCDSFLPSEIARKRVRNELKIEDSMIVVGHIGRYHPIKDHENYFKAAGIISANHQNVRFVLVGSDVDYSNMHLVKLLSENKLNDKLYLLGERSDIADIMAAIDIVVSSSWGESFPNVVGEAMACGVPCVVTDVGDSANLIGSYGLVVPPRDPYKLAFALDQLINMGAESRKKLGISARDRIIQYFSLKNIVEKYELLYKDMTSN